MYLNKEKISEIKDTELTTPLGSPVKKVIFMSQLDLTHEAIDEIREKINEIVKNEPESEERFKKLAELSKEEEEITLRQSTDTDTNKEMLVSQRTLDKCQTETPDPDYYYKRKLLIVGELLQILSEWGIEDIEFGQILQNVQDSYVANTKEAMSKLFGKSVDKLNMLDYHNVLTGTN